VSEVLGLKAMMKASIKNMLDGKLTKVFLDGAPQFMERERAMSKANVVMKKIQYLMRKVGADMVVIAQREGEITTSIHEMAELRVQKLSKEMMIFESGVERQRIKNVPGTSIKFETGDFETFEVDFDITAMHTMISQLPKSERTGKGQLQAILDFLDNDPHTITQQEKKVAAKVLSLNRKMQLTQVEISELVGVTNGTIHNWQVELGLIPA
jgi:hypothetical protein